jgi:hypothetical protein
MNGIDDWWGIGRTNLSSGEQWFAGRLDEVRVYSGVLTSDEIATLVAPVIEPGDFDGNGQLDVDDVNLLTSEIVSGGGDLAFDVNSDNAVDSGDLTTWVKDLKQTWIGDANLDLQFSSTDLVDALAAGTYEADVAAGWSTGDFNASGRFDSADLVEALADGGYEQGPRAAVAAVPEPGALVLLVTFACVFLRLRRMVSQG